MLGAALVLLLVLSVAPRSLSITPGFPDVPPSHPYFEAICDLASRGIISGKPDGKFHPDDPVMRQQFAKMIVKTMMLPAPSTITCPFPDVLDPDPTSSDPWYPGKYVATCALHRITLGKTDPVSGRTIFAPYDSIKRFQVLTMVVRALDAALPGLLLESPSGFVPTWNPALSPEHGANAARAEYNDLLKGINLTTLDPFGPMSRGEIAQVLENTIVRMQPTTAPGSGVWEDLGGPWESSPAAATPDPSRLDVYIKGTDGSLWRNIRAGSSWLGWRPLPESPSGSPDAASWGPGRVDVFWPVSTPAGTEIRWAYDEAGVWHASTMVALYAAAEAGPAACSWGTGRLDLFYVSSSGGIEHRCFNVSWWYPGSESLGGATFSDPAAASWQPGRLDVFVRGPLFHLWHNSYSIALDRWAGWDDLGGILYSAPAAVARDRGVLDVFARFADGHIYHRCYTSSSGTWSPWERIPSAITFARDPAACSWGPNRIDLFAVGTDGHLYHKWWDGTTGIWQP
ncbi:MAG: S-layer homology domain-containing protein [Thermoleophilia bacterium]|nr:S-layer homology domain-containing protein [Thermoleophilia bacterium]